MAKSSSEDQYSEQETKRRRDAVIKRMLATPPKPHSEMKVGKPRGKSVTPKRPMTQRKAKKAAR